jgi:hypothetical protein
MTAFQADSPSVSLFRSSLFRSRPLSRLSAAFIVVLAVAIQVQVTIPFTVAGLKLNAGDPVVAALVGLLVLCLAREGKACIAWAWRMPQVWLWLGLLTAVMTVSLLVGYFRLQQLSMWAVTNKYIGWFVLLGYFASGAYVSAVFGTAGQRLFLRTFIVFAALAATASGLLLLSADFHVQLGLPIGDPVARGLMGNSTAFAFLLLVALGTLYAGQCGTESLFGRREAAALMALLFAGLWFCGSRTAWGATAGLTLAAAFLRALPWREFTIATCVVVLASVAVALSLPARQSGDPSTTTTARLFSLNTPEKLVRDSSNVERFQGYRDAYALWREHKVLGIGLGGFLHDQQSRHDQPVVIHGTVLWILTEMGILGVLVFAVFAWKLVRSLRPFFSKNFDQDHSIRMAGVLALVVFGAMSLLHELLFQRVLWVMLGLVVCLPSSAPDHSGASSRLASGT